MEDLQVKFHALNATNLPEHYRNFNSFVQRLEATGENTDPSISMLKTRNLQEKILKAKLLLKCGRTNELLDLLLDGDKYLNHILTGNDDFLRSFVRAVHGEEFVERICPGISYVTRTRLVNRLPYYVDDAELARSYYESLLKRYGFKSALPFLVSCSVEVIRAAITKYRPTFTDRQLIYLHKKYSDVVPDYFEVKRNFGTYMRFARYLCLEDVEMFHALLEYGTPKIGKRAFSRFYAWFGDEVLSNPEKYRLLLRHRIVRSKSSADQYKDYITKLLPQKSEVSNEIVAGFALLPKSCRGAVLECKYGPETPPCPELLELLTPDDRPKYELPIEMRDVKESVPKLLRQIALTRRVPDRCVLVEKVIKTCKVNGDTEALLDVLQYFWEHHRSDIVTVRRRIFKYLHDLYDLALLSGEHWRYIGDLLRVFQINGEYCEVEIDVWRKFLVHRVVNGLDYVQQFKCLLKVSIHTTTKILDHFPLHERACILMYPSLIPEVHKTEEARRYAQPFILDWIADYNARNPSTALSYYDHVDAIEQMLEEQREVRWYYTEAFRQIFKYEPCGIVEEKLYGDIVRCFLASYYPDDVRKSVALWLVRRKPSVVRKHHEVLFRKWTDKRRIFREVTRLPYGELCIAMKGSALGILNEPSSSPEEVGNALNFLSFFDDFNLSTGNLCPNLDAKEHMLLSRAQLNAFQNVAKPAKHFAAFVELYKREHIRCTASLYNVVLNMPESSVSQALPLLISQSTELRSHGIHFACTFGLPNVLPPTDDADELTQKILTGNVLRCFVENQTSSWWRLLIECVDNARIEDEESFETLVQFDRIPENYLDRYIRLVWKKYHLKTLKTLTSKTFLKLGSSLQDDLLEHYVFDSQKSELCGSIIDCLLEPSKKTRLLKSVDKIKAYNLLESMCATLCSERRGSKLLQALDDVEGLEFELLLQTTRAYLSANTSAFAEFILRYIRSHGELEFLRKFLSRVDVDDEFMLDTVRKLDGSGWSKIVGLVLLPRTLSERSDLKMRYEATIRDIRDGCSDVVNVYLFAHLLGQ